MVSRPPYFFLALLVCALPLSSWSAEVWTPLPGDPIAADAKPGTGKPAIALIAPRGGYANGQAVAAVPSEQATAKISDLTPTGAGKPIPAASVRIRYMSRATDLTPQPLSKAQSPFFNALSETPVTGEPLAPVWFTIPVPRDATPGVYNGTLTVCGNPVPVTLTVAPYTAPAPTNYRTWMEVLTSPDTLALRYGVKFWSPDHWKLIEASKQMEGRLGSHVAWANAIRRTWNNGYAPLITFTPGAEPKPDFALFDKYMDLHIKYCGVPRVLCVWISEPGLHTLPKGGNADALTLDLTAPDGTEFQAPLWHKIPGTSKALLEGLRSRCVKLGIPKEGLMLALGNDDPPFKPIGDYFYQLDPTLGWYGWTHGFGYTTKPGNPHHQVSIDGDSWLALWIIEDFTPGNVLRGTGEPTRPVLHCLRNAWVPEVTPHQAQFFPHLSMGRHKQGNSRGIGRLGFEFWTVTIPGKNKPGPLIYQSPNSGAGNYGRLQRNNAITETVPGPTGPLSTARLEMLTEGMALSEACIDIEAKGSKESKDWLLKTWYPLIFEIKHNKVKAQAEAFPSAKKKIYDLAAQSTGETP